MKKELSREEYKLLVEKAPIMIWRSTVTMECDYFNEIWLAFTGRSMEQETGNGWAEGVHPEDFDRCLKIYTDHFAGEKHSKWNTGFADSTGYIGGYSTGACLTMTRRAILKAISGVVSM